LLSSFTFVVQVRLVTSLFLLRSVVPACLCCSRNPRPIFLQSASLCTGAARFRNAKNACPAVVDIAAYIQKRLKIGQHHFMVGLPDGRYFTANSVEVGKKREF